MTSSSNETDSRSLVAVRLTNPTPTPPKDRVGTAARKTSAKPRTSACRFGATKGHNLTDAMARPYTRDWVNGHPDGTMAFTRESAAWHSDRKPTPSSISACTSLPRDLGFRLNATARDRAQRARNFGRAAPGNGVIARCPDPPSQPRTAEFRALYRDSAREAGRGCICRTRPCDRIRVQRFQVGQVGPSRQRNSTFQSGLDVHCQGAGL